MLDLLCPLLGFPFVLNQPRKFVWGYIIVILFITCFYSAGMSTQFMFTDDEGTILDYFKQSYKIYVDGFQNIDIYSAHIAEHQLLGLRKISQMNTAREVFYHNKDYKFPKSTKQKLAAMSDLKILLFSGDMSKFIFAGLVNLFNLIDRVAVEEDYICGKLEVPEDAFARYKAIYNFWGVGSGLVYSAYRSLVESGFVMQTEMLIARQLALQQKTSWSNLSNFLGRPVPFGMDSPLGYTCLFYLALLSFALGLFIPKTVFWIFYGLKNAYCLMKQKWPNVVFEYE